MRPQGVLRHAVRHGGIILPVANNRPVAPGNDLIRIICGIIRAWAEFYSSFIKSDILPPDVIGVASRQNKSRWQSINADTPGQGLGRKLRLRGFVRIPYVGIEIEMFVNLIMRVTRQSAALYILG